MTKAAFLANSPATVESSYGSGRLCPSEHSAAFGRNQTVRRYGGVPVSDGALFFTAKKSAQKKAAPHSPGGLAQP